MTELDGLGKNVAALRRAAGLSQEEASRRWLISVHLLQNIEYGYIYSTAETLGRIARYYRIDPAVLGVFRLEDSVILGLLRSSPAVPWHKEERLDMFRGIALMREARGLTQRQVSAMSEVSVATLRNVEHGCTNVSVRTLEKLAGAFEVPLLRLALPAAPEEEVLLMVHKARSILPVPAAA